MKDILYNRYNSSDIRIEIVTAITLPIRMRFFISSMKPSIVV
jgi:hypothetical protein